jgi:DNA-binding MarR family transcriptional regulator
MDQHLADDVLVALRRITRAIDLHSRSLVSRYGLTVPQLMLLKELKLRGRLPVGELSRHVHLSAATVTSILGRLASRELIIRERSEEDRRVVLIRLSENGREVVEGAPGLLQDRFTHAFGQLADWEQSQILSSLQRVAAMMDADELDAAPLLSPGSSVVTPTTA